MQICSLKYLWYSVLSENHYNFSKNNKVYLPTAPLRECASKIFQSSYKFKKLIYMLHLETTLFCCKIVQTHTHTQSIQFLMNICMFWVSMSLESQRYCSCLRTYLTLKWALRYEMYHILSHDTQKHATLIRGQIQFLASVAAYSDRRASCLMSTNLGLYIPWKPLCLFFSTLRPQHKRGIFYLFIFYKCYAFVGFIPKLQIYLKTFSFILGHRFD